MNKASDDAAMRTGMATTAGAALDGAGRVGRSGVHMGVQCDRRCALLPAGWRHGSPAGEEGIVPARPYGYAPAHCGDGEPRGVELRLSGRTLHDMPSLVVRRGHAPRIS